MKKIKKMTLRSKIKLFTASTTVAGSAVVFSSPGGVEHNLVPVFAGGDTEQGQETQKEVVKAYVRLYAQQLKTCYHIILIVHL